MKLEQIIRGSHAKDTVSDQDRIDEAMIESFPSSDSPSWTSGLSHEPAQLSSEFLPARLAWKGDWNEVRKKLKQKFDHLTNDDLDHQEGQEDEVLVRLQKKLGKTREEIEDLLSESD